MQFFRKKQCPCITIRTYYSWFARRPYLTKDWEAIAKILGTIFSTEEKSIELTGRACRKRMDRLLNKFQQEDKKSLKKCQNSVSMVKTKSVLLNVQNELPFCMTANA